PHSVVKSDRLLVLGTFAAVATFVIFYLMTVFTLSWGTSQLGYTRSGFLLLQMVGVVFLGLTIPLSAIIADRIGSRAMLIIATSLIMLFGLFFQPLFGGGTTTHVIAFLSVGLGLMGLTYGPLGTVLAELFPTAVRYTGASLSFNLAGILGASLAPYIATWLASHYGMSHVGYYLTAAATVTLVGLLGLRSRRQPAPAPPCTDRESPVMTRTPPAGSLQMDPPKP
ncbi:MAG: MFS transporter, partial [Steroidobacteraceae bacterium]